MVDSPIWCTLTADADPAQQSKRRYYQNGTQDNEGDSVQRKVAGRRGCCALQWLIHALATSILKLQHTEFRV
jgi:hypothetical protein